MSVAGTFVLFAVFAGVIAFIVWPLIFARAMPIPSKKGRPTADPQGRALSTVQAEHESILEELRALDFDYQTGKILEDDYRRDRARLVALGADTLREIDQNPNTLNKMQK